VVKHRSLNRTAIQLYNNSKLFAAEEHSMQYARLLTGAIRMPSGTWYMFPVNTRRGVVALEATATRRDVMAMWLQ